MELKPGTSPSTNRHGLDRKSYAGSASTLCTGCGHDTISNNIITACYQSDIHPFQLVKMSGIGCSSKTPAYFMSSSFAFNSMHGRMAPVSTGAIVARPNLFYLGVSGDGDTGSIGLGSYLHMIRRNLPICYLIANNGVYGLTKGQFSATADKESKLKGGTPNTLPPMDLCSLALEAGCTFVARSFSGDAKQLVPLIQAGLRHNGSAVIDIISPCITFNNHDGSTKSYTYVKENDHVLQELGFIQAQEEKTVDYEEGTVQRVDLNDGSFLTLKKLDSRSHDVGDRGAALKVLRESAEKNELLTGLFFINEKAKSFTETLNLSKTPLGDMTEKELRPNAESFKKIQQEFK